MGLAKPALRFLIRCHKERPFVGPVLTLGRQNIFATYDDVLRLLDEEGVRPAAEPDLALRRTNIPSWHGTPREGNTSDVAVFVLLGVQVCALDISPSQHPDILFDLNEPAPDDLRGRFGVVLDAGTLEHVFDMRRALMNVASFVADDGRIIHISPGSNCLAHGFYQFSPQLFRDYYTVNGFADVRCYVVKHRARDRLTPSQRWWWYRFEGFRSGTIGSPEPLAVVAEARKTADSTVDKIPQEGGHVGGAPPLRLQPARTRTLPEPVKRFGRWALTVTRLSTTYRPRHEEPWGLPFVGRF